jgi:anti-sigma regulatory factor (Ser/Thr protein kinase)
VSGGPAGWRGARRAQLVLLPTRRSPGAARAILGDLLALWDCDDPDRIAELLTSELVTNAVLHARSKLTLDVRLRRDILRIAVTDTGEAMPTPTIPAAGNEGGRGLHLLAALARDWGVQPRAQGKTVWFELATTRGARPAAAADQLDRIEVVAWAELSQPPDEFLETDV